jgi:hypothetical protein
MFPDKAEGQRTLGTSPEGSGEGTSQPSYDMTLKVPGLAGSIQVNRRRRCSFEEQPLLLPGWQLNHKLRNIQHGATVIGKVFELATEVLLRCRTIICASDCDISPDAYLESSRTFVESKACGIRNNRCRQAMIEMYQLERYGVVAQFNPVLYCLWLYNAVRPVHDLPTIGALLDRLVGTVEACYVFDYFLIQRMAARCRTLPGLRTRHCKLYFVGREIIERDYLLVEQPFFDKYRTEPVAWLHDLGLEPGEVVFKQYKRQLTFRYNDMPYQTNRFNVFEARATVPF